jgi:hypothetical protein
MKFMEIFSGSGRLGLEAERRGFDVTSLDNCQKHHPTICCDILEWEPTNEHIDWLHSSPPCTEFSSSKTKGVRKLEYADSLVRRTLEIIDHYQKINPQLIVTIENVGTGLLPRRGIIPLDRFPLTKITMCSYGADWRKPTAIWTNLGAHWNPPPMCKWDCQSVIPGTRHHKCVAERGDQRGGSHKEQDLYSFPLPLCEELVSAVISSVGR